MMLISKRNPMGRTRFVTMDLGFWDEQRPTLLGTTVLLLSVTLRDGRARFLQRRSFLFLRKKENWLVLQSENCGAVGLLRHKRQALLFDQVKHKFGTTETFEQCARVTRAHVIYNRNSVQGQASRASRDSCCWCDHNQKEKQRPAFGYFVHLLFANVCRCTREPWQSKESLAICKIYILDTLCLTATTSVNSFCQSFCKFSFRELSLALAHELVI